MAAQAERMNFDLAALHFLRPLWLFGLPALPLLVLWWRTQERRRSAWRDAVDPHLLPHLLAGGSGVRGNGALWLGALAYALALVALAGPSWRMAAQPLQQGEAPLVVALDLSTATLANDLPPSRLLQARARIAQLLRERAGGQVGLVVFADDAFTVAPLTDDAANVALFLDALSPDVMPVDGSDPGRAIELSTRLLEQAGFEHGDILLLTDHAGASARTAAAQAADGGYRVSALGLGDADGAAYRKSDGSIARARLDAGSLRALAAAGNGEYRALGTGDLEALGVLAARGAGADAARGGKALVPQDGGYWLLPALMLLALFAFRRGSAFAAVLLCLCLPWTPARAQEGGLWRRADQAAHARSVEAESAYRKGAFAEALRGWQGLPGADAAYNRGNALAKSGRYEDAIAAYDEALRLQPGMADALANKRAVEAALKREPPPPPRDNSRGEQKQKPDKGKPKSNAGDPGSTDGSGDADESESPSSPADTSRADVREPGKAAQPPHAADQQRQRDADAAQREQMQRALEGDTRAQEGEEVEGKPERAESAADREQKQANEAWLRRVPDDPGGLLRAKFRLEHERRQQSGAN
jgi:Ca-activated chloride channel family protein